MNLSQTVPTHSVDIWCCGIGMFDSIVRTFHRSVESTVQYTIRNALYHRPKLASFVRLLFGAVTIGAL